MSLRRLNISGGNLSLMDYCTAGPAVRQRRLHRRLAPAVVVNGSQQQWLTRNSEIGGWSNGVWNQVFAGVEGAPADATLPDPPYTTLDDDAPQPREAVPVRRRRRATTTSACRRRRPDSRGITWADGLTAGTHDPARATSSSPGRRTRCRRSTTSWPAASTCCSPPGVYDVDRSIAVKRADTVVLGLGHATLTAVGGAVPLTVADVPGVVVAGVTIDAGTVESPGAPAGRQDERHGRATEARPVEPDHAQRRLLPRRRAARRQADVALEVNSDDVLIDHTWVWRADHGVEGFSGDTERWNTNTGRNGVVVNGDDVTATGLFVEHFQQYNTIWNGEDGVTILYQNELPYDPPTQADWMHDGVEGWAGYKVADHVRTHELYGGGVYVFNRNDPSIHTENGFEVPETPGVRLHHLMTVNLGAGTIDHVVNGVGARPTRPGSARPYTSPTIRDARLTRGRAAGPGGPLADQTPPGESLAGGGITV